MHRVALAPPVELVVQALRRVRDQSRVILTGMAHASIVSRGAAPLRVRQDLCEKSGRFSAMRAVVQRVETASVHVDEQVVAQIGTGLLVLLGVTHTDTAETPRAWPARCTRCGSCARRGRWPMSPGPACWL